MYDFFTSSHFRTTDYDRLEDNDIAEKTFDEQRSRQIESLKRSRYWVCALSAVLIAVAGVTGYVLGALRSNAHDMTKASSVVAARGI